MKIFTPALVFLTLAAPALAQSSPASAPAGTPVAYVCYYNAAGKFTSAKPAAEGQIVRGSFQTTGRGGDTAWVYGLKSIDGSDCPKRVRN